jgi:hypothetical protein
MPTGAELLIRTISELGISEIFTLVGDHLNEVLLLTPRTGIRVIDMRHESGVTHAADAWARIHRRPAISIVTGGPGHTNSLTGIAAREPRLQSSHCHQRSSPIEPRRAGGISGHRSSRNGPAHREVGGATALPRRNSVLPRARMGRSKLWPERARAPDDSPRCTHWFHGSLRAGFSCPRVDRTAT